MVQLEEEEEKATAKLATEAITKQLYELRVIFRNKYPADKLNEFVKFDHDCPCFCVGEYTIESTDDKKWYVLEWHSTGGSYYEPPDVSEAEVGTFDHFNQAVKAIWDAMAQTEYEVACEALQEVDVDPMLSRIPFVVCAECGKETATLVKITRAQGGK